LASFNCRCWTRRANDGIDIIGGDYYFNAANADACRNNTSTICDAQPGWGTWVHLQERTRTRTISWTRVTGTRLYTATDWTRTETPQWTQTSRTRTPIPQWIQTDYSRSSINYNNVCWYSGNISGATTYQPTWTTVMLPRFNGNN
jgi:hypothetical protein